MFQHSILFQHSVNLCTVLSISSAFNLKSDFWCDFTFYLGDILVFIKIFNQLLDVTVLWVKKVQTKPNKNINEPSLLNSSFPCIVYLPPFLRLLCAFSTQEIAGRWSESVESECFSFVLSEKQETAWSSGLNGEVRLLCVCVCVCMRVHMYVWSECWVSPFTVCQLLHMLWQLNILFRLQETYKHVNNPTLCNIISKKKK